MSLGSASSRNPFVIEDASIRRHYQLQRLRFLSIRNVTQSSQDCWIRILYDGHKMQSRKEIKIGYERFGLLASSSALNVWPATRFQGQRGTVTRSEIPRDFERHFVSEICELDTEPKLNLEKNDARLGAFENMLSFERTVRDGRLVPPSMTGGRGM
jgi:hypothetical protein